MCYARIRRLLYLRIKNLKWGDNVGANSHQRIDLLNDTGWTFKKIDENTVFFSQLQTSSVKLFITIIVLTSKNESISKKFWIYCTFIIVWGTETINRICLRFVQHILNTLISKSKLAPLTHLDFFFIIWLSRILI
jgi:hypothetical protein